MNIRTTKEQEIKKIIGKKKKLKKNGKESSRIPTNI
jgi:hypothetical protein